MLMALVDAEEKLFDGDLDALENALGSELPAEFRRLYLSSNGGCIDDAQGGNDLLLAGFVPIKHGRIPIDRAYKELVEDCPELKGKMPFAFDEGGIIFCLLCWEKNRGRSACGLWIPRNIMWFQKISEIFWVV